jgi:hypothetical protein
MWGMSTTLNYETQRCSPLEPLRSGFLVIVSDDFPVLQYYVERRSFYQNKRAELFHFFGASEVTILDTNFTNSHEANRESPSDW